MWLRKHLVLRKCVLPGKVDMTLVKGAISLCLSLRPWVGQEKGQTSSLDQPETPPCGPLLASLKVTVKVLVLGQKLCYLLLGDKWVKREMLN